MFEKIVWTLHRYHLTHPLIAIAVFLALVLPFGPLIAAIIPVASYFGREQRDAEVDLGNTNPLANWRVLVPWMWPSGSQWGFWPVLVAMILMFLLMKLLGL